MKSQKMKCVSGQPKMTQYLTPSPSKTKSFDGRNSEQEVNTKFNEASANLSCVHDSLHSDASNQLIAEINIIFETAKKKAQERIKEAMQQGLIVNRHDQKQIDISLGINKISINDTMTGLHANTFDASNSSVTAEIAEQEYEQADNNVNDRNDKEEEVIMDNLEKYESYIADCIRATDLIAFFDLFTLTHTRELRNIYKKNPAKAAKRALDLIKRMTNQPKKYRRLLTALDDAGYSKVVKILNGTLIPFGSKHRDILRHCAKHIYNCLNTTDILPHLYSKQIISKDDMHQIQRTERTESTGIAALELLDLLPNRNRLWYKHFIQSLIDSGHEELAKVIENNSIQITELTKSISRCDSVTSLKRKQEFNTDIKQPVKAKQKKLLTCFNTMLALSDEMNTNKSCDAYDIQSVNDATRNVATKKKHSKRIPSPSLSSDDASCISVSRHERVLGVSDLSFGEDER